MGIQQEEKKMEDKKQRRRRRKGRRRRRIAAATTKQGKAFKHNNGFITIILTTNSLNKNTIKQHAIYKSNNGNLREGKKPTKIMKTQAQIQLHNQQKQED